MKTFSIDFDACENVCVLIPTIAIAMQDDDDEGGRVFGVEFFWLNLSLSIAWR